MNCLIFCIFLTIDFRVSKIDIQGNHHFSDKAIKNTMLTKTKGFLRSGKFNATIYNGDITAIKNLYENNGFLEAEIKDSIVFDSTGKVVELHIQVNEGNQTKIKTVDFTGNILFSKEFLKDKIITQTGISYDQRKIETDNYIITSLYDDLGYTDVQIHNETFIDNYEAKILYQIIEGEKQFIEGIEISGLTRTKNETVLKEIILKPEDTFRYARVLQSRRNLTNLGIFSSIRSQVKNSSKQNFKIVQFIFSEKKPIILDLRVGYGTRDYLRLGAGLTHINMFGNAWKGKIEGKLSFAEYRLNSEISFPRLFALPAQDRLGMFYQFKKEIGFNTRYSGLYNEIHFNFLNGLLSVKYNIDNIQTYFRTEEVDSTKNDWLNGIVLGWLRDKRDDPIFTNSGNYANIGIETGGIFMPSEVNYLRPTTEFRFFKPFLLLVLGVSFKAGTVQAVSPSSDVPVYKRFYCGGTTSVRGYNEWAIGPRDTNGNPTGGKFLFETSVEFRFPIYKILGGVLFIDAGNVWQEFDNINFKLKWAIGPGIRLRTPLGSLRLDYGFKIKPEPEESRGALHFAVGEAF